MTARPLETLRRVPRYGTRAHLLSLLAAVCIASKLLTPAGFMAVGIDTGWLIKMCHTGLPSALLHSHHHSHGHHGDDAGGSAHELEGRCPLGALAGAAALAVETTLQATLSVAQAPTHHGSPLIQARLRLAFRSRGPPRRSG